MSKFNQGDQVTFQMLSGITLDVVAQIDELLTCVYTNSEGKKLTVVVPAEWLIKVEPVEKFHPLSNL